MSKHPGGKFCVQIKRMSDGSYDLFCVIRFDKLSKVVEQSPPFPLTSEAQACDAARQCADAEGFSYEEIVWE